MISWIQHHLIRHGRWVFLSLLAVIIVAFVFTIGNTPGCTTDRSGYEENLYYGIDLNSPLERDIIVQKVSLSVFLNGQELRSEQQFQSVLNSRIAMLHLADEIGVPAPTEDVLAEYVRSKNAFRGPDGQFSSDEYTRFVDNFESNPRASQGLLLQVLAEDYRIEAVDRALTGPGYLLPSEALAQTRRGKTKVELATAEFDYSKFSPDLEPTETELLKYYEANQQRYEIPERIKADYVFFPADKYADQNTEFDEAALRQHFAENRAEFVEQHRAGQEAIDDEVSVTLDIVREIVRESLAEERATRLANEAAQAFVIQLYRDQISRTSAAFTQLLHDLELSLQKIEPYTMSGASKRARSPEMLQSAFTLNGNRYYSDPHPVDGGFAVLIYKGRIAPEIPPFENVADEARTDYASAEKRRLFNERGESLKAELEAAVAGGKGFLETAESLGLKTRSFDSFALREAPAEINRSAINQAERMSEGEISPMLTLDGHGTFVFVQSKKVPEIDRDNEDFTKAQTMLQQWSAFSSRSSLLNALVTRGMPEEALAE